MDSIKIFKYVIAINVAIVLLFIVFLFGMKLYQNNFSQKTVVTSSQQDVGKITAKKEPVEVIEKRDSMSKTFDNRDGTYTSQISSGPIHFTNKEGELEDIDLDINKLDESVSGYDYVSDKNNIKNYFKKDISGEYILKSVFTNDFKEGAGSDFLESGTAFLQIDDKKVLPNKVDIEISENTAKYNNIFPNVDSVYDLMTTGVKHSYIINEKLEGEELIFSEKLRMPDEYVTYVGDTMIKSWIKTEEPIVFKKNDVQVFSFIRPFLYSQSSPEDRVFLNHEIVIEDGYFVYNIYINNKEIKDFEYPLVVDPTYGAVAPSNSMWSHQTTHAAALTTASLLPVVVFGHYIRNGTHDSLLDPQEYYIDRTFLSFDTAAIPDTATILTADIELFGSGSTAGGYSSWDNTIEVYSSTWGPTLELSDWSDSGALLGSSEYEAEDYNVLQWAKLVGVGIRTSINKTGNTYYTLKLKSEPLMASFPPSGFWGATFSINIFMPDAEKLNVTYTTNVIPTAVITAPAGNQTEAIGTNINFDASASTDDGSITTYEWSEGSCGGTVLYSGPLATYSNTFALGSHTVYLRVQDNDSAWSTNCPSILITVQDQEDPTISITSPSPSPHATSTTPVNITGTASDNLAVTFVSYSAPSGVGLATYVDPNWTISNLVLVLGQNDIIVTATDAAGNTVVDTVTINYNPDSVAPVVSILQPSATGYYATTSDTIRISGNSTDDSGSVNNTRISVNGNAWSPVVGGNSGQSAWYKNNISLDEGINEIVVRTLDSVSAGNYGYATTSIHRIPLDGRLIGYVWTDTVGWISMSSLNCHNDTSNYINNSSFGCSLSGTPYFQYNVKIDQTNGQLSGYAWSENVGWISFEQVSTTPDNQAFNSGCLSTATCTDQSGCTACYQPNHPTKPLGIGAVYGWANILSLGDDGWINLGSNTNSLYGVEFNILSKEFSAYAWSGADSASNVDAGLGWVSFSCVDDGDCGVSNYRALASLNLPPTVSFIMSTPETELPCGPGDGTQGACDPSINCEVEPVVDWLYNDPEGYTQASYRFIIDEVSGSGYYNSGIQDSSITQIKLDTEISIKYDTVYDISIEVWDNFGLSSGVVTHTFRTDQHQYPNPKFTWFTPDPSAEEQIQFTASSTYYNDSYESSAPGVCYTSSDYPDSCEWLWTLGTAGTVSPNNAQSVLATFDDAGSNGMNLIVTDGDGYSCSTSTVMEINKKLPSWIEVR